MKDTRCNPAVADSPYGGNGDQAAVCRCGAGPHPELPDRCAGGHLIEGNQAAMVHGTRSAIAARKDLEVSEQVAGAILRDFGFDDAATAPTTLKIAADALGRASSRERRVYQRTCELGDSLDESRAKRANAEWVTLFNLLLSALRIVGVDPEVVAVPPRGAASRPVKIELGPTVDYADLPRVSR